MVSNVDHDKFAVFISDAPFRMGYFFYLKGVAPPGVTIGDIYKGVIPFVLMQLLALVIVFLYPQLALWLPKAIGW